MLATKRATLVIAEFMSVGRSKAAMPWSLPRHHCATPPSLSKAATNAGSANADVSDAMPAPEIAGRSFGAAAPRFRRHATCRLTTASLGPAPLLLLMPQRLSRNYWTCDTLIRGCDRHCTATTQALHSNQVVVTMALSLAIALGMPQRKYNVRRMAM